MEHVYAQDLLQAPGARKEKDTLTACLVGILPRAPKRSWAHASSRKTVTIRVTMWSHSGNLGSFLPDDWP